MSSESEKQFFIQKHLSQKQGEKPPEEPQVSPEKRKKAIQYAEEIKRIREKEILTEEDSVRVEELAEKLKRIYSPEIQFESEEAKKRLEKLKETPLWDEERRQWNYSMDQNQELLNSGRLSGDQLLGVLVEAITGNLEGAKERLKELKKTSLWDEEREQWNDYMDENQELRESARLSHNQLLGVLVAAITGNLEGAKERLKKLKETPLWDKEREQWNWGMNEGQDLINPFRLSNVQLLGVLAEAITDNSREAKKRLEKLKKIPLWDEEREQWNDYMDENQEFLGLGRLSGVQLLGVLAEAVTGNIEGAKERLEELKETPLWNEEIRQWNVSMDENQKLRSSDCRSHSQLIGVLVEAFHEKEKEFVEWLIKEK